MPKLLVQKYKKYTTFVQDLNKRNKFLKALEKTHIVRIFCCLLVTVLLAGIMSNTIKPLPKVNKEFLVVVHVVLDEAGNMGVDTNMIKSDFAITNGIFKPIEVSFKICEFRIIRNFQFNDTLNDKTFQEVYTKYQVANRINVYYIDGFKSAAACGKASLGGIARPKDVGVFIKKVGCGASVLEHELGHYFNLEHTFEISHGSELVNGSNCTTAGDGVCDTPADPFIDGTDPNDYVDPACLYKNTDKDANGAYYDPDVSNIMSYYTSCVCGNFTPQQYERMANYYLNNKGKW